MSAFADHGLGEHTPQYGPDGVDLDEVSRQLGLAAHDIAVAATCMGLGDLDEAHINVITARAEAGAAEEILRVVLTGGRHGPAS